MTSTSTFTGDSSSKPSSRVLRPPGGGSSIIFGGAEDDTRAAGQQSSGGSGIVQKPADTSVKQPEKTMSSSVSNMCGSSTSTGPVSGQQLTNQQQQPAANVTGQQGSGQARPNRNCGYNLITGESYSTDSSVPTAPSSAVAGGTGAGTATSGKPTTSIGIRQPPGGASTKLW